MSRRDGKKSQSQTTLGEAERASLIEDICNNVRNDFADAIATIVGPRLDRIEEKLNELSTLRATVSELENAVEHTSAQWTISSAQRYLPWLPMCFLTPRHRNDCSMEPRYSAVTPGETPCTWPCCCERTPTVRHFQIIYDFQLKAFFTLPFKYRNWMKWI